MEIKELNYQNFPYIYEQYLGGNFEALLKGIAEIKAKYLKKAIDTAISDIFDLKTAKGNALDMWGRLLDISRFIPAEFDFDDETEHPINEYQTLSDDDFRLILIWAFQSQNFDITITNLKEWLNGYFNMGAIIQDKNAVNITDFQDMSERVLYSEKVADFLRWVLTEYDLIPRPASVLDSLIPIVSKIFSFKTNDDDYNARFRTNFYFGRFVNESDKEQPIYERLNYLTIPQNAGNNAPFIDTGLALDSEYEFEVKGFMQSGYFGSFIVGYLDNNNRQGNIFYNANNKRTAGFWRFDGVGQNLTEHAFTSIDMSQEFQYVLNKHKITISQNENSETYQFEAQVNNITNANANILLFRYANSTTTAGNGGAIKEAKISKNGELLRHFIPVRRTADNVFCFYDLVTNAFFENANSSGGFDFIEL